MKEKNNMMITINGGQFNMSKDTSTLNANQYNWDNNINSELESIINAITDNIYELEKEMADQLLDIVEMAKSELIKPTPRPSILRNCIVLLAPMITIINGTPKLVENLNKLSELIKSFLK